MPVTRSASARSLRISSTAEVVQAVSVTTTTAKTKTKTPTKKGTATKRTKSKKQASSDESSQELQVASESQEPQASQVSATATAPPLAVVPQDVGKLYTAPTFLPAVLSFSLDDAKEHLINADPRFEDVFAKLKCRPFEHLERLDPFR